MTKSLQANRTKRLNHDDITSYAELKQMLENNPPDKPTCIRIKLNKDSAALILAHNKANRPFRKRNLATIIGAMVRGQWRDIGDTIRISASGHLQGGQHTCQSVIDTDHEYEYLVVLGLEDEAMDNMDQSSKRQLGQNLGLKGVPNPLQNGATLRMVFQIEEGATPGSYLIEPTFGEYYDYLMARPQILASSDMGMKVSKKQHVPASAVAAAHYFCAGKDLQEADDFFSDLAGASVNLPADSPVLALDAAMTKWASRGSVSRAEQASLFDVCVRAFDDHMAGKSVPNAYRLNRRPKSFRMPA